MKISYRTHPILEWLKEKQLGTCNIFQSDKEWWDIKKNEIREQFHAISLGINHQIYSISQSFIDSYEFAADKLWDSNLWHEVEDDNICFLIPSGQATMLNIRQHPAEKEIVCRFFDIVNKKVLSGYGIFHIDYKDCQYPAHTLAGWVSGNMGNVDKHILNCVLMTIFIKYAKIEVKYLPPNKKEKLIDCNYVNDTKMPVVLLNSTWFTTLVKSDAFKVRGHFRLQPKKKDGEWTKELIWITDFEKHGYTAPARKLNVNQ
jgi:hypothetical protein